ncbi:unnamed protein product [Oncorhynchus mykiss]|uniref:UDENN domain-containing protein n=1 Tax=Oncorhynchus mykiss TaxID=8022 RepID=A0A060X4C3_ONCMY|nr:unnamed protein product [Oncorhynchus mykiss]
MPLPGQLLISEGIQMTYSCDCTASVCQQDSCDLRHQASEEPGRFSAWRPVELRPVELKLNPEDNTKGGSRRSVYVQSTLKRRPVYHSLERDLIQLQQQQLFQFFVVVSLRKSSTGNTYTPEITQQFPNKVIKSSRHSREADDRLKAIPMFCFPDSQDWRPSGYLHSETFPFVLTGEDGSRCFCYCRKILVSVCE